MALLLLFLTGNGIICRVRCFDLPLRLLRIVIDESFGENAILLKRAFGVGVLAALATDVPHPKHTLRMIENPLRIVRRAF